MEKKVLEKRPALCRFAKAACYLLFAPAFIVAAISGCSPSDAPTPSASRLKASMGDGSSASSKTETEKSEPKAPEKISPEEPIRSPVEPSKKTTYPVRFYFGTANPITLEVEGGNLVDEPNKEKNSNYPRAIKKFYGWYEDAKLTKPWNFKTFHINCPTDIYAKYDAYPLRLNFHAPFSEFDITHNINVEYGKPFDMGSVSTEQAYSALPDLISKLREASRLSRDDEELAKTVIGYGGEEINVPSSSDFDFQYVAKTWGTGSIYASTPEELFGKEFYRIKTQGLNPGFNHDYRQGSVFDFYPEPKTDRLGEVGPEFLKPVDFSNFGRVPQTLVTDSGIIKSLDAIAADKTMSTNEDGNYVFRNKEYRYAIAHPYSSTIMTLESKAKFEDGKRYWFEVKPIEWRTLKTVGDYSLITPKKLLFVNEYDDLKLESTYWYATKQKEIIKGKLFTSNNIGDYKNYREKCIKTGSLEDIYDEKPDLLGGADGRVSIGTYFYSRRRAWFNGYSSKSIFRKLKWMFPHITEWNSYKERVIDEASNHGLQTNKLSVEKFERLMSTKMAHDSGYHPSKLNEKIGILGQMSFSSTQLYNIVPFPLETCRSEGDPTTRPDSYTSYPLEPFGPNGEGFEDKPITKSNFDRSWHTEWDKNVIDFPQYRDRVFLLSNDECAAFFKSDEDRTALPTDYALAMGSYQNTTDGTGTWDTRTLSGIDERSTVGTDGIVDMKKLSDENRRTTYEGVLGRGCVRPAMWVRMNKATNK